MRILITGGAGYIGSHAVKIFKQLGHDVIVVDNLSTGYKESVDDDVPFYHVSIHDHHKIETILEDEKIEAVIHFAASSLVGESVEDPLKYYYNNVEGTRTLVQAMVKKNVNKLIFSSTAAVYGEQKIQPIDETAALAPSNPYGETKRIIETMLSVLTHATSLRYVSLRYFNVAGAYHDGSIGEDHNPETHLIPNLLKATLNPDKAFTLYGTNHQTKDGTAVRDYVHVEDLVEAHKLALDYLVKTNQSDVFNLGTEQGYSVKEILDTTMAVTNQKIKVNYADKRPGDPATLIASHQKAYELLNWRPKRDLKTIIESAYRYYQKKGEMS